MTQSFIYLYSRMFFFAVMSLLLKDDSGFIIEELEFDLLSRCESEKLRAVEGMMQPSSYIFVGSKGEIATAFDWQDPDEEMILEIQHDAGIKKYPPHVFITMTNKLVT